MDKRKIKFIGKLNNYKKYPRVKGARRFTYFDENYGFYGAGMTDFYPSVGVIYLIVPIIVQIACTYTGFYLGLHFDLGLFIGWMIDSLLKLWPVKYYSKIKIGWNLFEGIIFISENPIPISIYKRIEKASYWIRTTIFILIFIGVIYVLGFQLSYLDNYLSLGSFCIGLFILVVGPINRGSVNYRKIKEAPNDLLLIHHNGSTYSIPKTLYDESLKENHK